MNRIIYFYYDYSLSKTVLIDRYSKVHYSDDTPIKLLKKSCFQYGTSYDGVKQSFRYLTGAKQKIPICISIMYQIIFIPLYSEKNENCIYIQYQMIKKVERIDNGCIIHFKDGYKLEVCCDIRSINRQIKRCKMYLEHVLNPESFIN